MLAEKDYCDYEICVALKELGFDSLVDWYFKEDKSIASSLARYRNTYIPRISLYEAQKWLREEKKIYIDVACNKGEKSVFYNFEILTAFKCNLSDRFYSFYEEALSEGIKNAVKLLKE